MKVIVATENSGGLKAVDLGLKSKDVGNEQIQGITNEEGKSAYVQKMIMITRRDNKRYIVVARKGGLVQMHDEETFKLVKEWKSGSSATASAIVGLEYVNNDKIVYCTSKGHVVIRNIDNDKQQITTIHEPVSCFRMHRNQVGVAAAGGKDRDTEIVQILPELMGRSSRRPQQSRSRGSGSSSNTTRRARIMEPPLDSDDMITSSTSSSDNDDDDDDYDDEREEDVYYEGTTMNPMEAAIVEATGYTSRMRRNRPAAMGPPPHTTMSPLTREGRRFQQTRAGAEELLMDKAKCERLWRTREPEMEEDTGLMTLKWVTDVQFLDLDRPDTEGWKFATGTKYGDICIFDTASSKRPILKILVSNHPVENLWLGNDERRLIFTDSQFLTGRVDCILGECTDRFRTAAGCGLNMDVVNSGHRLLISIGGLDGVLRIHDLRTGDMVGRAELTGRISSLMVVDACEEQSAAATRGVKRESSELDCSTTANTITTNKRIRFN